MEASSRRERERTLSEQGTGIADYSLSLHSHLEVTQGLPVFTGQKQMTPDFNGGERGRDIKSYCVPISRTGMCVHYCNDCLFTQ